MAGVPRMTIERTSCTASNYNLIYGPNAAGKTSVLEALAYLGRGKSFRGAGTPELIRHGTNSSCLAR